MPLIPGTTKRVLAKFTMKHIFLSVIICLLAFSSAVPALAQQTTPSPWKRVGASTRPVFTADPIIIGGAATAQELRFLEPSGGGTNYTMLKTQSQAANATYTFPATLPGVNGQSLTATTAGLMSWATTITNPANNDGAVQFNDGGSFGGDSTKFFWDNVNKRLGIGTSSPARILHTVGDSVLFEKEGSSKMTVAIGYFESSNLGPSILLDKARGTIAAPEDILVDDIIGSLEFSGMVGGFFVSAARVSAIAETANLGGALIFETRPVAGNMTERLRVSQNGLVGINVTDPDAMLEVAAASSTTIPLTLTLAAAHSANAFEINSSGGAGLLIVDNAGALIVNNGVGIAGAAGETAIPMSTYEVPGLSVGATTRQNCYVIIKSGLGEQSGLVFSDNGTNYPSTLQVHRGRILYNHSNDQMVFDSNHTTVMKFSRDSFSIGGIARGTPAMSSIQGINGSGTDIAGAAFDVRAGQGTGTGVSGVINLRTAPAGSTGSTLNALVTAGQFDASSTAGDTRFFLYDVDNATLERVTVGVADSAGGGFKVLRIPN